MKIAIGLVAGATLLAQTTLLSPSSEFDLVAVPKTSRKTERVRSYFRAGATGLTFVEIGQKFVSLSSADLRGRIIYSTRNLTSVELPAVKVLFRWDGSIWVVSSPDPLGFDEEGRVANVMSSESNRANMAAQTIHENNSFGVRAFGPSGSYIDLARYSSMGKPLESVRLARPAGVGWETPMAAFGDMLVLRTTGQPVGVGSSQSEGLQFGTVVQRKFRESVGFHLDPPVTNAIPLLFSNGDLLLIHMDTGNIDVIDPTARKSSLARLSTPMPVHAASVDGNYLYLLSGNSVLTTDLSGRILATFRFQQNGSFDPAFLGVVEKSIYLVDKRGHANRFEMN